MKNVTLKISQLWILLALGAPMSAFAHGDARAAIELESSATVAAGKSTVVFQLIDLKDKKVLKDSDLDVMHEKKMHFVFFDPALKEFRHEHPVFANDRWSVSVDLPRNGTYWMWAEGMILADGAEFAAEERLVVTGGLAENAVPSALGDVRQVADGISQVTISSGKIKANKHVMLNVTLSRTDGSKPEITPYLGATAHVIAASLVGEAYIHAHAIDGNKPNVFMIHTEFPAAGDYRVWVQFIDGGVLRVVPLSVQVGN